MRPRLRDDAVFLRTGGGLRCECDSHAVAIAGADAADLGLAVSVSLTGEHTVEAICRRFDPSKRAQVVRLIELLAREGIVTDSQAEAPDLLPASVRDRFRRQLAFVRHVADAPVRRFHAFRTSRILLAGAGVAFQQCAISLAAHGLRTLSLWPTTSSTSASVGEPAIDLARVSDGIDALDLGDLRPAILVHRAAEDIRLAEFDLVAFCADEPDFAGIRAVNRHCARAARPFLPAIGFRTHTFLGPLIEAQATGCWTCGFLRLVRDLIDETLCGEFVRSLAGGRSPHGASFETEASLGRALGRDAALEIFRTRCGGRRSPVRDGTLCQQREASGSLRATVVPNVLCACMNTCLTVVPDAAPDAIYRLDGTDDADAVHDTQAIS